jgi:hypothetical protein
MAFGMTSIRDDAKNQIRRDLKSSEGDMFTKEDHKVIDNILESR